MDPHRSQRVSETIREELSELIGYEMDDPRIGAVDVTEVFVTPDMRHARVRLHLEGDEGVRAGTLAAVEGARHYLRRELMGRLNLFRLPELHFEADVEAARDSRLAQLFKRARKGRPKEAPSNEESILK
jgi:ribosome-binding factor A